MQTKPLPQDVSRGAIPAEYLELAGAVVQAHNEAEGTPAAWSNGTFALRIAAVMKIAADRAADEVRAEYAPKCLVCGGACLPNDSFDTDECEREHYTRIANDRALDARTTAHMDARQMGEVA